MGRPKKQAQSHVIKASAAIQIHGKITLLQRRAWNVLLANAYDELPHTDRHSMPVVRLMQRLEFDSKNDDYLKESLRGLVRCHVEWNILDKDGDREWGVAALLAEAKIKGGICTYEYSSTLRERLHNPRMYARLCLSLQNKFASKHALALWELCTDYLGSKRDYGETPWITLEDFRKLMGIEDSPYYAAFFKKLNQQVLTPAIAEIHRVSDFQVTVDYQRHGRKVIALKFQIRRVVMAPDAGALPTRTVPDPDALPEVVRELQAAGLAIHEAWDIWQRGFASVAAAVRSPGHGEDLDAAFAEYVREKIHLLKRRQAAGKVDNSTGFLVQALRQNYANPEYAAEKQQEASRVQRQAEAEVTHTRQGLTRQKAAVETGRDQELQTLCGRMAEEQPEVLEQAVAWALQEVQGFHLLYHRGKTALDNYRDRVVMQALLNPYLERHAPERFVEVRDRYTAEIAALESQLRDLQP